MQAPILLFVLTITSAVAISTVVESAASTFATREAYILHLNAVPGRTWTAGTNSRFAGKPIGHSKVLCGVNNSLNQEQELIASGKLLTPPKGWDGLPDPPAEFDSATNWPHCAEIINDIRDQSDCGFVLCIPCKHPSSCSC